MSTRPPTAILLGCVKTKRNHAPAKDLYCSTMWKYRRAYAESTGRPWLILSAKHHLVEPDTVLRRYNLALKDLPPATRRAWGRRVVDELAAYFRAIHGATFEVHAGAPYRDAIAAPLARHRARITAPLEHRSFGEQLQWYARRTATVR
jgi:hypothetical protein